MKQISQLKTNILKKPGDFILLYELSIPITIILTFVSITLFTSYFKDLRVFIQVSTTLYLCISCIIALQTSKKYSKLLYLIEYENHEHINSHFLLHSLLTCLYYNIAKNKIHKNITEEILVESFFKNYNSITLRFGNSMRDEELIHLAIILMLDNLSIPHHVFVQFLHSFFDRYKI